MNCANHIESEATAFCRTCGKALCANCTRDVRGVVYCEECIAARLNDPAMAKAAPPPYSAASAPYSASAVDAGASPGLAAVLGFIPGVGAMYNGQFGKGFLHVLIFASLIWMADHGFGVVGGVGIPAWVFYMVFDAYKTAKARRYGLPIPDPLGINNILGGPETRTTAARMVPDVSPTGVANEAYPPAAAVVEPVSHSNVPTGAIVLIVIGAAFLLDNLGIFHFHWIGRMWPLILIAIGVNMFIKRGYFTRR